MLLFTTYYCHNCNNEDNTYVACSMHIVYCKSQCLKDLGWEDWIFFLFHDKSEWRVLLYIVICDKIHRQFRQYIDTMNIMFTL